MTFLNPLHAFGFYSWKKIESKDDFYTHITNSLQYSLNLAIFEWESQNSDDIEKLLIEQEFIQFFNNSLSNDLIYKKLLENNKNNTKNIQKITTFTNPFKKVKNILPKAIEDSSDLTQKYQFTIHCNSYFINKENPKYKTKIIPKASLTVITNANFINKESELSLLIFNGYYDLQPFDIFLLKCIEYCYAYAGFKIIIISEEFNKSLLSLLKCSNIVSEMHIFSYKQFPMISDDDLSSINTFIYYYQGHLNSNKEIQEKQFLQQNTNNYVQIIHLVSDFNTVFNSIYTKTTKILKSNAIEQNTKCKFICTPNIPLYMTNNFLYDNVPLFQTRNKAFYGNLNNFNKWKNTNRKLLC